MKLILYNNFSESNKVDKNITKIARMPKPTLNNY